MKLPSILLAYCVSSISVVNAQSPAPVAPGPEKPAPEKPVQEAKPEGPLEERVFKILKIVSSFPDVLVEITDEVTANAAKAKLEAIATKLEAQTVELKKMATPSDEARKKLTAKLDVQKKALEQKMQKVSQAMLELDPETIGKIGDIMEGFSKRMQDFEPTMKKYLDPAKDEPDKEETEEKETSSPE